MTSSTYSLLFESLIFWNQIREENVLIFQVDSFLLRTPYNILSNPNLKYGFIGAIYTFGPSTSEIKKDLIGLPLYGGGLNGGLSLRKKSIMIDCIKRVTNTDIINWRKENGYNIDYYSPMILPEDVYFLNAIPLLKYELASPGICNLFFIQEMKYLNTCGIHGFDKDYNRFSDEILSLFLVDPIGHYLKNLLPISIEFKFHLPKIIDCILFSGEIDMLVTRLEEMKSFVDQVVIVECGESFTLQSKSLSFSTFEDQLKPYQNKITYLPVDSFPVDFTETWEREAWLRYYPFDHLRKVYSPQDIVLVCDVDEIPNPVSIRPWLIHNKNQTGAISLEMEFYYYNFQCQLSEKWRLPYL